ncbi:FkbM family methyltransferase [Ruegeria sp. MALMAid1280]|uniref:FkbM family methyltransferase n=1 Tax=Ruegeria sp. MALMAid1280 TaxID=3411634 RepID=UPI003BA1378D
MDQEVDFLKKYGVTVFLDVGANVGQTGISLRKEGYEGRIISFEPIRHCYDQMEAAAASDPLWDTRHSAVGAEDGTASIGVSENFVSSSILDATEDLIAIYEPIRYTRQEEVPLTRLDSCLPELVPEEDDAVIHLKIDTQGFERFVIDGALDALHRINTIRMEVAVSVVYSGEMIVPEAIQRMTELGYVLIDAWPAWRHPETDEVMHFDLLFRRL